MSTVLTPTTLTPETLSAGTLSPGPVVAAEVPAAAVGQDGWPGVVVMDSVDEYSRALDAIRRSGRTVGVVPTMGALHRGHRALIERAALECDVVAVSIFVNPTQFGSATDLAHYPRTLEADLEVVASAGGQIVFAPSVSEMYPDEPGGSQTVVSAPRIAARWEGASRPGHFDGVATVVVKLLSVAGRCRAYFGEKDFQQLALVRRVVKDLGLPTEVVGCETVRDDDGLALSSRNVRLTPDQRRAAPVLHRALQSAARALGAGHQDPATVEALMAQVVATESEVALDYAVVVHADDLEPVVAGTPTDRPRRLLIAAQVGLVRLIDNLEPDALARPLPSA